MQVAFWKRIATSKCCAQDKLLIQVNLLTLSLSLTITLNTWYQLWDSKSVFDISDLLWLYMGMVILIPYSLTIITEVTASDQGLRKKILRWIYLKLQVLLREFCSKVLIDGEFSILAFALLKATDCSAVRAVPPRASARAVCIMPGKSRSRK